MSESYSPSGTYPTFPLTLPEDGELINHAILVDGMIKPAIDAAGYVNSRVTAQAGAKGASVVRTLSNPALPLTGTWAVQSSGSYITSVNTACTLQIPISAADMPNGVTLTGASVNILPAAHASIVGLTLPKLSVYYFDTVTGLNQIGATTDDPSLSAVAYSLQHSIPIASLSHTVDRTTRRYFLYFTSEVTGAQAAAGDLVVNGSVTYTAI